MDSSTSSEQLMERSFSEYSSIDESLNESFSNLYSEKVMEHPVAVAVNKLLQFQSNHHISNAAIARMADIQNETSSSEFEIPKSKQKMERYANMKYSYVYYVFCKTCKEVTKLNEQCAKCKIITERTRENFFIAIPLKQQIELSLHKNFQSIM